MFICQSNLNHAQYKYVYNGFDIDELTELTPALDTAMAAHDTAE